MNSRGRTWFLVEVLVGTLLAAGAIGGLLMTLQWSQQSALVKSRERHVAEALRLEVAHAKRGVAPYDATSLSSLSGPFAPGTHSFTTRLLPEVEVARYVRVKPASTTKDTPAGDKCLGIVWVATHRAEPKVTARAESEHCP